METIGNRIPVAEAMVESLSREGVRVVFGYPGAAICPFYDALTQSSIRHILVRQEQNAGHAASGYARMTGRPGVCIATSGPGATNMITAIATAYMDSIPLIVITGQVGSDQIGRDVFQEADITGACEPFVKHSYLVKEPERIPLIFKQAFYIAGSGRPGPVLIDIPFDVQKAKIAFDYPDSVDIRSYKPSVKGHPLQIKRAAAALAESERPLLCLGGGVFAAGALERARELAERAHLPVVTTMMGIGSLPTSHPQNFGMIGMHGVKAANLAVRESDLLILIGARVGDRAVSSPELLERHAKVIHIDVDPAEIGKNLGVSIPIVGDAGEILAQLLERVVPMRHDAWMEKLQTLRMPRRKAPSDYADPREFVEKLTKALPDDAVVVADVGQNQIWTALGADLREGGRFLTSGGMGTMGYSLPAAIGAKLAAPEKEVIAICGDGSFQMQFMELATACQHGVSVKVIVMTNNRLGMVREVQTKQYGDRQIAVALDGSPDFTLLAAAYGIEAQRVERPEDIDGAVSAILAAKGPFFTEVLVDPAHPTL